MGDRPLESALPAQPKPGVSLFALVPDCSPAGQKRWVFSPHFKKKLSFCSGGLGSVSQLHTFLNKINELLQRNFPEDPETQILLNSGKPLFSPLYPLLSVFTTAILMLPSFPALPWLLAQRATRRFMESSLMLEKPMHRSKAL